MQTAIIYTRVSTDDQAEKGFSLRDQKDKLVKYCDANGIEVLKHFEDDGYSAKTKSLFCLVVSPLLLGR